MTEEQWLDEALAIEPGSKTDYEFKRGWYAAMAVIELRRLRAQRMALSSSE